MNLLDNATKYVGEGGTVTVAAAASDRRVAIRVADDGPGIPDEMREAVFERFVCVDRARTRASGGSGLGLPIARWIAEAHGGALTLAPNGERGCVCTATLPAAEPVSVPEREPFIAGSSANR
jgi:signal transduction histidine kinase